MDSDRVDSASTTSRRRFLAGLLAVSGAVLAGCDESPGVTPPDPSATPQPLLETLSLDYDVCVVGGGAAGCAAAVSAARAGARTVLLEESFILGGNTTRGLVNLDRVSYGGDHPLVEGFFREVFLALEARGEAVYPGADTHFSVPYDADGLRRLLRETAQQAGVDVHLGAHAAQATVEDRGITRVWAYEQGHTLEVRARTYVDCTGEGHLGYMAGNGYSIGDPVHGQIQGQTLIFYAGPVDFERVSAYVAETGWFVDPYQAIGVQAVMDEAVAQGRISGTPQHGLLINKTMKEGVVSISGSETYQNHLEPGMVGKIAAELEEQDTQIHEVLREQVPGFESSSISRLADRPYLREGRRLSGHTELTADHVLAGIKPDDSIARGWYPIDLHAAYLGGPVRLGQLQPGDWYGIPYGCLVARDLDNLLMAGRCISVTHEALGSTRISPVSMALGQAAGIAAALASKEGKRPADVTAGAVQSQIADQDGLI